MKTSIYRLKSISHRSFREGIQNTSFFLRSWFLAELSLDKPCGVHVKSICLIGFGQSSTNWFDNHMVLFIHMNLEEVWLPPSLRTRTRVRKEGNCSLNLSMLFLSVLDKNVVKKKKCKKFCRFTNYCHFLSFSECISANRVFVIALV